MRSAPGTLGTRRCSRRSPPPCSPWRAGAGGAGTAPQTPCTAAGTPGAANAHLCGAPRICLGIFGCKSSPERPRGLRGRPRPTQGPRPRAPRPGGGPGAPRGQGGRTPTGACPRIVPPAPARARGGRPGWDLAQSNEKALRDHLLHRPATRPQELRALQAGGEVPDDELDGARVDHRAARGASGSRDAGISRPQGCCWREQASPAAHRAPRSNHAVSSAGADEPIRLWPTLVSPLPGEGTGDVPRPLLSSAPRPF